MVVRGACVWCVLVRAGACWCVLVRAGARWCVLVRAGARVGVRTYLFLPFEPQQDILAVGRDACKAADARACQCVRLRQDINMVQGKACYICYIC